MESGFTSLPCPLWAGRGLSIFCRDRREVFALLRGAWRVASGKSRIKTNQRCLGGKECLSSLVQIPDLERWRDDVRTRQRGWIFKKGLTTRITTVVVAGVVVPNSDDYTSGRQRCEFGYQR